MEYGFFADVLKCAGMLTVLVKTVFSTNNNTLAKSVADTNTNTAFEKYCKYQYKYFYFLHLAMFRFLRSSINKVNKMIIVEKMAKLL